ncbi:hypothetical protein [Genomoviridae sp.]|nr:hypothetical protein [Genomoviridae sp.]
MAAAPEYGPSGPTQVKDINPAGTGLSDAAAAFIAANCSPFTNPRDMPCPAKVPDPRNTQNTETMFLWSHFDITPSTVGTQYNQMIVTSADPLAPVPIQWMGNTADLANNFCTPNIIATQYEKAGMSDLVYQMRQLGKRAKSYRVVGHGLKVWVSRNTNISRGSIEAGQYAIDDFANLNPTDYASVGALSDRLWTNQPTLTGSETGPQAMAMTCRDYTLWKQAIATAKDQEIGFLAADEGATVRWTDTNDFHFMPCVDRGLVQCSSRAFGPTNGYKKYETTNTSTTGDISAIGFAVQFTPAFILNGTYNEVAYDTTTYRLGTLKNGQNTGAPATVTVHQNVNAAPNVRKNTTTAGSENVTTIMKYYATGSTDWGALELNGTVMQNYYSNSDAQFNKGLFADIIGIDQQQILTVQVCWHIEYVPKGNEPWSGEASPVDSEYETLAAIARNRLAFPIVVKGHSFFSSLKKAFGKAISAVGKIFETTAPIAQQVLGVIPHPAAQVAAMGLGTVAGAYGQLKRLREE